MPWFSSVFPTRAIKGPYYGSPPGKKKFWKAFIQSKNSHPKIINGWDPMLFEWSEDSKKSGDIERSSWNTVKSR